MAARTQENTGNRAWLMPSSMALPLLPERVWRGTSFTANLDLPEVATGAVMLPELEALADAELEVGFSFPSSESGLATLAANDACRPVSSPAWNQNDEAVTQSIFQRLRDASKLSGMDEHAALRDHLVLLHTPLVEHCARSLAVPGEPLEDLVQEGYMGLIKAVDRFNPAKGARFSTYAYHLVAGEIRHYLRDLGKLIHEPGWHSELRQKINRQSEQLTQQLGRTPSLEEVATALDLPVATVHEVLKRHESLTVESLDGGPDELGVGNLVSSVPSDESYIGLQPVTPSVESQVDNQLLVQAALPHLSELERHAVQFFFYEELSKTEIARRLGISINYAAYLVKRGLKHLRQIMEADTAALQLASCRRAHARSPRPIMTLSARQSAAPLSACCAACRDELERFAEYPAPAQEVMDTATRSAIKLEASPTASAKATHKLAVTAPATTPLQVWQPTARHIEVPLVYRNNVAALPEFTHWLHEEVGLVARSSTELYLVWYKFRSGCQTMIRLDAAPAAEAVGAAQAIARRWGRNIVTIKRPARGAAATFYFCVTSSATAVSPTSAATSDRIDEDILLITSPSNFTRHAQLALS